MTADTFRFPSLQETLNHPAYPGAKWNLIPDRQGKASVAKDRSMTGPIDIAWQIHGHGPIKLVFIMGLATSMNAWQRQTCHFGHRHADRYSALLLDNRGIGVSDKPLARYTTSDMAADVLEVLDHVGWTADRSLHLVGLSLGGMIAQELACAAPARLRSLTLVSTTAALESDRPVLDTLCDRFALLRPRSVDGLIRETAVRLFPPAWLAAPDEAALLPSPRWTPRCGPPASSAQEATAAAAEVAEAMEKNLVLDAGRCVDDEHCHDDDDDDDDDMHVDDDNDNSNNNNNGIHNNGDGSGGGAEYLRFATNYQRYHAEELTKQLQPAAFSRQGALCQLAAVVGHRKSPSQLRAMADALGRDRILVLHGASDRMISPSNGERLIRLIRPDIGLVVDGMGHAPIMERAQWFNELLEDRLAVWSRADDAVDGPDKT